MLEDNNEKNLTNGATPKPQNQSDKQELSPEVLEQITSIRTRIHELYGQVAMAMMVLPRYRNQTIGDLKHLLLEPLIRDRVAIANAKPEKEGQLNNLSGIAIWASVNEEVDTKIREQIKAGVFPIRLKEDDWTSGNINWLLDVIAPDQKMTTSVIANFKQVVKQGDVRIHPLITRLVDAETLKKMGASPVEAASSK